jgi:N utilization substance protein B
MSRRTRAREVVLQALYQLDLNPTAEASVQGLIARRLSGDPQLIEFARLLLAGVLDRQTDLDRSLEEMAANWSVGRMAVTDRNILRLGAYELLHTDTPGAAVINEAVELAKRFGNEQSGPFVNGILDQLLRQRTGGPSGPRDASAVKSGHAADGKLEEPTR